MFAITDTRLEAEDRWRKLKKKLHWNPLHLRYMKLLKQHRKGSAHPSTDKFEAALEIPESEKKISKKCSICTYVEKCAEILKRELTALKTDIVKAIDNRGNK